MDFRRWLGCVALVWVGACSDDGAFPQEASTGAATADGGTGGGPGGDDGGTSAGTGGMTSVGGSSGGDESGGTTGGGNGGPGYCPGVEPWPRDVPLCLSQDDCAEFETCSASGPPEGPQCGACAVPLEACMTDGDCMDPLMVCAPFAEPCACKPGLLECKPPCDMTGCAEGEQCEPDGHCVAISCEDTWECDAQTEQCDFAGLYADAHGCAPIPCDDGWTCPDGWVCMPDGIGPDQHGCVPVHCSEPDGVVCEANFVCDPALGGGGCAIVQCTSALDCDCGSCVEGVCRPGPGVCVPPPPP